MAETNPLQRVKRVSVEGLFGMYDHDVPLNLEERVTILYGLNGSGKTTLLQMLCYAGANRMGELVGLDFKSFTVDLDEGESISWSRVAAYPLNFTVPVVYYNPSNPHAPAVRDMIWESMVEARRWGALSRFNDKAARLLDRLNSRLLNKTATLSPEGHLRILDVRGRPADDCILSSGERALVVRTTLSIFGMRAGSLLLLDEPEQSTHLFWQQQVVSDLLEDAKEDGFDVILTTHSPDIIGPYEHLAVGLPGKAK